MYYVVFNESLTEWWDVDKSKFDGRQYYPAPTHIAPGTPCKLVDGKVVVMSKNEIDELNKKQELKCLINNKIHTLTKECDRRIQTIPAERRTAIIGRRKNNDKHYTNTWQHFYQRCQNLRHDQDVMHPLDARQSAAWVVERIEKYSEIKDKLKKEILNMSYDQLQAFDPTDPAWWVDK